MDEYLLPDYPLQPSPIDCNNIFSISAYPFQSFNYDNDDGLSAYVPSESISVSQLMSDTGLPLDAATRLVAKLSGLYAYVKAKYAFPPVAPLRQVESFIDFDELLSVYDVPPIPCSFDAFTLNDDSDDEPYDSDDDSQFFFSSFDDSSLISPLSESAFPPPTVFPLFCLDSCSLVAISTRLFSDEISDYKPFSIGSFFDFSKFEHRHKWKIYRSFLPPVVIFISWIFLTCSL
jgi:hypothetical protein